MIVKTMKDFLSRDQALKLNIQLKSIDGNWWRTAVHTEESARVDYYDRSLEQEKTLRSREHEIDESLRRNHFTYKFSRTTKHVENCACPVCLAEKHVVGDQIRSAVMFHTEMKNPRLYSFFASAYGPGDFLSTHTDTKRDVAFMLYLTPNWLPEYGGLLNVYDNTVGEFKTFVPQFNTLAIMDLRNGQGRRHFVSEVSARAPERRLALTGWFNEDS